MVVFLGPGEMGRWQQRELQLALDRQAASGMPVVPVLLPGCRPALGFLSLNTWVDLRSRLDEERPLTVLAGAVRGLAPAELKAGEPAAPPAPSARSAACSPTARRTLPSSSAARTTPTDSLRPSCATRSWPSSGPPVVASRPWCVPAWCRS